VQGSTLEFYRAALRLRRELGGDESLQWVDHGTVAATHVLRLRRSTGWESVTNLSGSGIVLPAGEVLLASSPLGEGVLPPDTTVWLRPAGS
jgi:alpha-glucosidase